MKNHTQSPLITGASRGIGLAIAEQFLYAGYKLLLVAKEPCFRVRRAFRYDGPALQRATP